MEKIFRIEETNFKENTDFSYSDSYCGYTIVTDKQTINIGISDGQDCCEQFGYLTTNDNINDFIGAELISIVRVDNALNNKEISELKDLECGGAIFINLETTAGLLQFVVYNSHNGYYGHSAVLISKQLTIKETL